MERSIIEDLQQLALEAVETARATPIPQTFYLTRGELLAMRGFAVRISDPDLVAQIDRLIWPPE